MKERCDMVGKSLSRRRVLRLQGVRCWQMGVELKADGSGLRW